MIRLSFLTTELLYGCNLDIYLFCFKEHHAILVSVWVTPISVQRSYNSLMVWFGLFVWWHINLRELFNAKAIFLKEQQWYSLTNSWGRRDKEINIIPWSISPKENVKAQVDFELTYFYVTVQLFNHYTPETQGIFFNWYDLTGPNLQKKYTEFNGIWDARVYKTHGCIRRTLISAGQIKKKKE